MRQLALSQTAYVLPALTPFANKPRKKLPPLTLTTNMKAQRHR
jgi:hypothetical protein